MLINGKEFNVVQYDATLDIDQLASDEKAALEPGHKYIDYSYVTDDYSWSRSMAYINLGVGETQEQLQLPHLWYVFYNETCKFIVDPDTYQFLISE